LDAIFISFWTGIVVFLVGILYLKVVAAKVEDPGTRRIGNTVFGVCF